MTQPNYDKLNQLCAERCRTGKCNMECEVCGAKVGYCQQVWDAYNDR